MSLPFTDQQCFFVAMLAFVVVGFQRGWRRELVSLVFILMAALLVNPNNSKNFGQFFARLPGTVTFLLTGVPQKTTVQAQSASFFGPWGSLLLFALIVALGYYIGHRAFPAKPATPQERFLGIVPAVISGAFVLAYLSNFFPKSNGHSVQILLQAPDPGNFVPVIFVIAVVAVVIALVTAARAKKPAPKK